MRIISLQLELLFGKGVLKEPNTGTRVLGNTRPFLRSSIVSFWITLARFKERAPERAHSNFG